MKKKYLKLIGGYSLLIIIVILIVIIIKRPKSYTKNYNIDNLDIEESYSVHDKFYKFNIIFEDRLYEFGSFHDYIDKKELIQDIKFYETDNNEKCVYPIVKNMDLYPLCFDGEKYMDYDLLNVKSDDFYKRSNSKEEESFKNIDIFKTLNINYLVWANKGYYFISEKEKKELFFLEKESYYNNLAYQVGEYVITPNYDEDFTFKKFFIIDLKKGKVKEWNLPFEISYNSYFLGDKDGIVYLFDRKEKKEYSINPRKKKIERIDKNSMGKIWNDGFEEVSVTKLANEDFKFVHRTMINYEMNDSLTLKYADSKYDMILSLKKGKIISRTEDVVYYLVDDELYSYTFKNGEELLLKYNEWNFNNINSIFVL